MAYFIQDYFELITFYSNIFQIKYIYEFDEKIIDSHELRTFWRSRLFLLFFIFTKILTVHMNLEAKVIDLDKLPIKRGGTIPWWYYTLRV